MPDAISAEGTLPRTYMGLTLGDPVPAEAKKLDDPPTFYPTASQYLLQLTESPKTNLALYVHNDAIFRIEWRIKDASLDRSDVAEAFSKHLGPPEEPSEFLPKNNDYWNDGLKDGKTTITIYRIGDGEWFRVAFEDAGRTMELLSMKKP